MTSAEFTRYRTGAGLSITKTATLLGVNASTIYRWEHGQSPIPSDAADTMRAHGSQAAEHRDPVSVHAYRLGRLWSYLEWAVGDVTANQRIKACESPRQMYALMLKTAQRNGRDGPVADLLAEIPSENPFPVRWPSLSYQGDWWLGYYHARADVRAPWQGEDSEPDDASASEA